MPRLRSHCCLYFIHWHPEWGHPSGAPQRRHGRARRVAPGVGAPVPPRRTSHTVWRTRRRGQRKLGGRTSDNGDLPLRKSSTPHGSSTYYRRGRTRMTGAAMASLGCARRAIDQRWQEEEEEEGTIAGRDEHQNRRRAQPLSRVSSKVTQNVQAFMLIRS